MNWQKYSVEDRRIPGISALAVVLLIVSLYLNLKLVFFLAALFLLIAYANKWYFKKIGERFFFENNIQKRYFFMNQDGEWNLTFHNEGLPILNGEIKIFFDQVVAPKGEYAESNLNLHEVTIPFSILNKQSKQITITFKTKMRGVARIQKLELHIPNMIGFGESILEYKYLIHQEVIVFPNPIPVEDLKELLSMRPKENPAHLSIYEDRLAPLGTRDYLFNDSFNRIHWKASARKQSLQTKIYEQITDKGWNIAINISDGYAITGQLEQLLSSVTEFAYFAYKKQIPYSLCVNISSSGKIPFQYIPVGEGYKHLQTILKSLASVNANYLTLPYEKMLIYYHQHLGTQPYFIHAGKRTSSQNAVLLEINKKQALLFELMVHNQFGKIIPLDV
jgi:uncharacterized protein (DUF58 family)